MAGDFRLDGGTLAKNIETNLKISSSCVAGSGWRVDCRPQIADFAITQDIQLHNVKSFVGWHSRPCASGIHNAVIVFGAMVIQEEARGSADVIPTVNTMALQVYQSQQPQSFPMKPRKLEAVPMYILLRGKRRRK